MEETTTTVEVAVRCPTPDGSFKHEVCTMFWQCSNRIAHEFNCQTGLAWNDALKTCDSQSLINCPDNKIFYIIISLLCVFVFVSVCVIVYRLSPWRSRRHETGIIRISKT
jgi:hypothetical protein